MAEPTHSSSHTRLFCLLGNPVSHSKSPAMMNAAFAAAGLDAYYLAMCVGTLMIGEVLATLKRIGCGGANVTAPHKQAVIPFLDRLSDTAEATGSVNTIVFDGDSLVGHSTDGRGLVAALAERLGAPVAGKTTLVLGAGGAARGVLPALTAAGAGPIVIANRSVQKAEELARRFGKGAALTAAPLLPAGLSDTIGRADIVINATALPVTSPTFCDLDLSALKEGALVFDMNYGPDRGPVARALGARGVAFADGLAMLLFQGAASFSLWTGKEPPLAAMRSALGL